MRRQNPFKTIHPFTGSLFVLLAGVLLSFIAVNIDFFNPLVRALEDYRMTDVVYSNFKDPVPPNENIVLINIGPAALGREGFAALLDRINQQDPAVVAVDAFFFKLSDPDSDRLLASALGKTHQLVMASKLDHLDEKSSVFRTVRQSAPKFLSGRSGFANFITDGEEGYLTTRRFSWHERVADSVHYSFCAEIVRAYDSTAFRQLEQRSNANEIINYRGNLNSFQRLDFTEVLDPNTDLSFLRSKLVLMGYLGDRMGQSTLEDCFYTPLNPELGGRSVPDMYGIVVHANILAMILDQSYITEVPTSVDYILGFVLCLFNAGVFIWFGERYRQSAQLLMRVVQLIQGVILSGLVIYFLAEHNLYLDVSFSLAILFITADFIEMYDGLLAGRVERLQQKLLLQWRRIQSHSMNQP